MDEKEPAPSVLVIHDETTDVPGTKERGHSQQLKRRDFRKRSAVPMELPASLPEPASPISQPRRAAAARRGCVISLPHLLQFAGPVTQGMQI